MNPDNDAQATDKSPSPIWNTLLSSSVALAAATGLFYFIGGAAYEGRAVALGLNFLAGLQPGEYIFAGVEYLLVVVFIFGYSIAAVAAIERKRPRPISRRAEWWISLVIMIIATTVLAAFSFLEVYARIKPLAQNACPVTSSGHMGDMFFICLFMGLVTGFVPLLFPTPRVRRAFLGWCIVATLFCLYIFGLAAGAAHINDSFPIATIATPSIASGTGTNVLVLASDATNLVVLSPNDKASQRKKSTNYPEPLYLLRSEVKSFRLVGECTINNFFCK